MAKTSAERVSEWRERVTLKADYFHDLDKDRIARLGLDMADRTPEYAAVRAMCLNYPAVKVAPSGVGYISGGKLEVYYGDEHNRPSVRDMIAAFVALREISSLPVQIIYATNAGGGWTTSNDLEPAASAVRHDVQKLRELGMWTKK